jgi:endoglucanase
MTKAIYDLLKELSKIPGPVGREERVQTFMKEHLSKHAQKVSQDKIGNLIATIEGTGTHYALVAHCDEVGFFVSNIDDNGFLRVKWNTQSYLPDMRLLPGQRVKIMTEKGFVPGFFGVKTAHIAGAEGKKRLPKWEEVFVDIGATSKEDASSMGINVGDPMLYDTETYWIGKHVVGKTFDDRIGLVQMIIIAQMLAELPKEKRPTVTLVSTVMEEIGAKGAASVAGNLDVDGVLILEVGLADDYPGTKGEAGISLGKGPVIVIKDSQIVYSHALNQRLIAAAEKTGIDIQRAVYHNYATDGFQMASQGQRVAVVGIPCRYTHSSFETINLTDVEAALNLIMSFILD